MSLKGSQEYISGTEIDRIHENSLFAGLALLLASVGVYGVLAFNVGRRSREIGIRIALGATPKYAIGNVFFRGFTLVLPGLVLGLLGAWALGRYIKSQLYGVTITDPLTYAIASSSRVPASRSWPY